MSASPKANLRPLLQIRNAASELSTQGKHDEALELFEAALRAVLQENAKLELLLKKLRKSQAGKSNSEKLDARQLQLLFELLDEDDGEPDIEAESAADAELDKAIEKARDEAQGDDGGEDEEKKKKKKKRRRNKAVKTEGLEVKHTHLELPEDKQDWEVVGEQTTTRLRYSPAHFYLEEIHQPIVRDPAEQEDGSMGDEAVEAPPTIVDGMPGNDVLAMLLLRKFEEQAPLHRLHRQFLREQGVDIPVSTMADWVAWGGAALQRMVPPLLTMVQAAFLVQTDATGMRVLDSGPEHVHRGSFHAYLGRSGQPDEPPNVVFHYTKTGEAELGPWQILKGREGFVLADASNSFDRLFNGKVAQAIEVGCSFHARRPFKKHDSDPRSAYVLQLVRRLYRLETLADAKQLSWQERTRFRQKRSRPVLAKLKRYLVKLIRDGTPDDAVAKGAQYYINHWDALTRFTKDGRLPLDNNEVERLFRHLRIGERNFLFAGSDDAAERMGAIYSILTTAKSHGVNLFEYLCDILDRLSYPMSEAQIAELLPHRWSETHRAKNADVEQATAAG